jgi:hypothetical protein
VDADQVWATIVLVAPGDTELRRWRLAGNGRPDLEAVDRVARLALAARRQGCEIRVRDACGELTELLELVGLRVEVCGEPERCEEVRIEEVVVADDPVA